MTARIRRRRVLIGVITIVLLLLIVASLPIFPPEIFDRQSAAGTMGGDPGLNPPLGAGGGGSGGGCAPGFCKRCNVFGNCYCSSFCEPRP